MSGQFDLRSYKKAMRDRYRAVRMNMEPHVKQESDRLIREQLLSMPEYERCKLLLTYVSTPEEADTHALIAHALSRGKRVAVPYCIAGTRRMDFYLIESVEELVPRTFGVLEPVAENSRRLTVFKDALCIVPGIAFDKRGYRLGYGGGYYDRFLSHTYHGVTVGLCYSDCAVHRLVRGRYDIPCSFIVTEKGISGAFSRGGSGLYRQLT